MPDIHDPTIMQALSAQAVAALILPVAAGDMRWLGDEPPLSEMLADPITQMLMRRDGVQEAEIRRLVARLRDRTALKQTGLKPAGRRAANDLALEQPL